MTQIIEHLLDKGDATIFTGNIILKMNRPQMVWMKAECNSFVNIYKLVWLSAGKWTEVYLCFEKVRKIKPR